MPDEQVRLFYQQAAKQAGKRPYPLARSGYIQGINRLSNKPQLE